MFPSTKERHERHVFGNMPIILGLYLERKNIWLATWLKKHILKTPSNAYYSKNHTHKKCYEAPFQIPYLSTPCLNHELTSKVLNRCRFQWPQDNTFIKRVPWNYSPVIKHRGAKRLPLSMVPQVCLKPKWFYHWQKCLKINK